MVVTLFAFIIDFWCLARWALCTNRWWHSWHVSYIPRCTEVWCFSLCFEFASTRVPLPFRYVNLSYSVKCHVLKNVFLRPRCLVEGTVTWACHQICRWRSQKSLSPQTVWVGYSSHRFLKDCSFYSNFYKLFSFNHFISSWMEGSYSPSNWNFFEEDDLDYE